MNTLRWGVLGTAKIGAEHVIPAIQKARNGEVLAIASRRPGGAEATADALGIPERFDSYEALLASDSVDAVYIPLPNHLHAEWTKAAAAVGKHVLCEKPLALSAAQAGEMIDACAAAGVVLMEAFMYRLHPTWLKARELVATGRIGELQAIQTQFGYFNDDPDNIRNKVECGGGALMDVGCYAIDLARWMFDGEPTGIQAKLRRHPMFGTDVVTSALMEFGQGQAVFTVSTQVEDVQTVSLLGTEGRIAFEIPFNIPPDRTTHIYVFDGGDPPASPNVETWEFAPADPYTLEAEAFARTVLEGVPLPTPVDNAVANMRVIERVVAAGS